MKRMDKRESQFLTEHKETKGCSLVRITGTVLVIIFHLLQFLYYSERDTRQPCKLANTDTKPWNPVPLSFLACRGILRRFLVRLCKRNNIFLNCQIIRTKNDR